MTVLRGCALWAGVFGLCWAILSAAEHYETDSITEFFSAHGWFALLSLPTMVLLFWIIVRQALRPSSGDGPPDREPSPPPVDKTSRPEYAKVVLGTAARFLEALSSSTLTVFFDIRAGLDSGASTGSYLTWFDEQMQIHLALQD